MPRSIIVAAAAAALASGIIGTPGITSARGRGQATASPGLPNALRRAAIATRSDAAGEIAGAQVGDTGTYVVYVRSARGCGSGGCRAQVWRTQGGEFVRGESMPVGRLPLVVLSQSSNGMPVIGVTVFDKGSGRTAIMPVGYDGRDYTVQSDRLLPANSGRPLVTDAMLRPF